MLKDLKGMKYPDEALIRFFFKEGLHAKTCNVIEFGSDNGCNLQLFSEYGHSVLGVDFNSQAVENANFNFELCQRKQYRFVSDDMCAFLKTLEGQNFDVVLIPSSVYYLPKSTAIDFLADTKKIMKKGTKFFLRLRDVTDYRSLNGTKLGHETVKIDFETTGEKGATMSFFTASEIKELLTVKWEPARLNILKSNFQNIQNGIVVDNADIIVFGEI